ncbi:DoxX family protein [Mycobacterium montefiorense]|uniref:Membrane protein n=1 Tax=Mycobacterium montefiorense TaxID=154654 RepID=A0AA37UQZ1_9MYCO|nr:DoxX family protein [Mycobacterium montefiorense]GBG36440.1 membrane protein [Mycobacterium montefiorense]GKU37179.1 membrane protein [Mycobacterium montefiorense]GKU43305.1 membrane protein [Mycobacterium montefiorense]GKU43961.1 membrane protein [Mycobacterium montefiorense]GKU53720.1 membrane protein [Mycobacterium montefiorense]
MTGQSNDAPWQRPGEAPEPGPARPAAARLVDPEDDLTPVGYPGDFGPTSVIPYQDPNQVASPAPPPYNVLDQHEPLPYVQPQQPQQAPRHLAAEPAEIDASEDFERERAIGRRGTQNLGLLVLRVGLGVVLGAHGLQKLFGWWGGQGIGSFKNSLSDVGYQHADILSYVSAGGEIVSGALLVLGLFTPVAAAGALAFLINGLLASISARPHTFAFFLPQGHEYQIMLIVIAVAVVLAGPGRYGLDANRGWAHRPFIGSFVGLLAGIAAGIAVWVLLNGVNPVA